MDTSTTESETTTETGQGTEPQVETIPVPKTEWEKSQQTIGSLKRQIKDLTKPKEEPTETPKNTGDLDYGQKAFLKASGLSTAEEMQLAQDFAKRTGDPLEVVLEDDVFKGRLERLRTTKANENAADGGKRGTATQAHDTVEYWLAKLKPDESVPDSVPRALREKIVAARVKASADSKVFYNDK